MPLTEENRAQAREIIARYPEGRSRSALLPMLHLVQSVEGFVTPAGIAFCADELGLTKAEVGAVATFYTMYKRKPVGDYLVSVCTNLSCQILGGEEVYARLADRLGVGHNETTTDGSITLEHAECLAACDYAPVLTVNYEFYDNVTADGAEAIVDALRAGTRPLPTRGAPVCTFKEIEYQLAGFRDPRPGAVAGNVGLIEGAPAHPDAQVPVDVRGSEPLPTEPAEYAVPGGETERVLTEAAAAASTDGGPAPAPAPAPVGRTRSEGLPSSGEPADVAGAPSATETGAERGADQQAGTDEGPAPRRRAPRKTPRKTPPATTEGS